MNIKHFKDHANRTASIVIEFSEIECMLNSPRILTFRKLLGKLMDDFESPLKPLEELSVPKNSVGRQAKEVKG